MSGFSCRGPNIKGLPPREASDRLQIFQTRFDELWRKFTTYSGGEELFGLAVTGSRKIETTLSVMWGVGWKLFYQSCLQSIAICSASSESWRYCRSSTTSIATSSKTSAVITTFFGRSLTSKKSTLSCSNFKTSE